jgi:oxygen-independent coproporphyrinogen-3 oxidase
MKNEELSALIARYDVPVPRYTSYPTVPFWEDNLSTERWKEEVRLAYLRGGKEGISLYIHLPFCERLCTYCGCNKRITINHGVETPYLQSVLEEWRQYKALLGEDIILRELHLGGGTPTFFSAENLRLLLDGILKEVHLHPDYEFGVEIHPTVTNTMQLQTLFDLGFKRLSVGVQDFDETVQAIINRRQTFEETYKIIATARAIGYDSINVDLIYGLPRQTLDSVRNTIEKIRVLKPERIAFYSYAHVPWKSKGQRHYTEADLPQGADKRALYELGVEMLREAGYYEIGMDHFALAHDELYRASRQGTLHRNFMGYTPRKTELLVGLGASSISDTGTAFAQNNKEIEGYQACIRQGNLAVERGHVLNAEDRALRQHILGLLCHGRTSWQEGEAFLPVLEEGLLRLKNLEADKLVRLSSQSIEITDLGKKFIRNIASQIDARLWRRNLEKPTFSQAV